MYAESLIDLANTIRRAKGIITTIADMEDVERCKLALDLRANPGLAFRAMLGNYDADTIIRELRA